MTERKGPSNPCGHVPFPGSGGYGHWVCERGRFHLGRHRYRNYTTPRIPRVWDVKTLLRYWRTNRKWAKQDWGPKDGPLMRYSAVLHKAKYQPVSRAFYPITQEVG